MFDETHNNLGEIFIRDNVPRAVSTAVRIVKFTLLYSIGYTSTHLATPKLLLKL